MKFRNPYLYFFEQIMLQFFNVQNHKIFFLEISPGKLLIIFYQLTWFKAASCNNFQDIFTTSFQWPNLQRAITQKKIK